VSVSYVAEQHAYMPGSVLAKDTQLQNLASKVFEELESSDTKYSDVAQNLHSLIDWMAVKGGRPPKNFKQRCLQFQKELALVPLEKDIQASVLQLIDKASRKRVGLSASAKWGIGLGSAAAFMALAAVAAHARGKRFTEPLAPLVVPVFALGAPPAPLVVTAPASGAQGNGVASGVGGGNDDVRSWLRANSDLSAFNDILAKILAVQVPDEFTEDTSQQYRVLRLAIHAGIKLGECICHVFYVPDENRGTMLECIVIPRVLSPQVRTIILSGAFRRIISNSTRNKREVLYPKLYWFFSKFDFDLAQDVGIESELDPSDNDSWLEFALMARSTGVVKFLVDEKKCSIDQLDRASTDQENVAAKSRHGRPLRRMVMMKDQAMIKFLLKEGARSDIPSGGGDTVDQLVQADSDEKFKAWFQEKCRMRDRMSALRKGWMGTVMRAANSRASSTRSDGFPQCGPVGSVQAAERAWGNLKG
jgi:hypothetical protein